MDNKSSLDHESFTKAEVTIIAGNRSETYTLFPSTIGTDGAKTALGRVINSLFKRIRGYGEKPKELDSVKISVTGG